MILKNTYADRLIAYKVAVADTPGSLPMFFGSEDSSLATLSENAKNIGYVSQTNRNRTMVDVITLDSFLDENLALFNKGHVDLIKIDTEGYEYNVLKGAQRFINILKPKFIQIEYNWHQLFENHSLFCIGRLLPGYRTYQLLPLDNGWHLVDLTLPESNIYHYSNFVFVREDLSLL